MRTTILVAALVAGTAAAAVAQPDPITVKVRELQTALWAVQGKGDYFGARKQAQKIVDYLKKKRGQNHPETLMAMQIAASMYSVTGDQLTAQRYYEHILRTTERIEGPNSVKLAGAIDALASSYWAQQRLDEAEALFARSLAIYRKSHGAESTMFAAMLMRQAGFLQARYMFAASEQVYRQVQAIYLKADPPGGPKSDQALNIDLQLGMLYGRQGDLKRAEKAFDAVISGYEKKYGKDDTARLPPMLLSMAMMYDLWGRPKLAKQLNERTEKAYRAELGRLRADPKTHPAQISGQQTMLAMILTRQKKFDEALGVYKEQLAAQEQEHGKDTFQASASLYQIADIHKQRGEFSEAKRYFNKLARAYGKAFGGFNAAMPNMWLGEIERITGNYKKARELGLKVVSAAAKTYGVNHPMAQPYNVNIAFLDLALGEPKKAHARLTKAFKAEKKAIALVLAAGTESDNRTYLTERRHQMHLAVTLHSVYLAKNNKAIELGLDTVLVHKGRVLDASASSVSGLRQRLSEQDRLLLDKMAAARSELAKLVLAGPKGLSEAEYAKQIAALEAKVRTLETQVRGRSAVFRAKEQPIDLGKIRKAIPKDAALVEIVSYHRVDPKAVEMINKSERRYGAYVLARTGPIKFVDLGPSKGIDQLVDAFRSELSSPKSDDYIDLGQRVYRRVFKKIEPLLGKQKIVLLAPDGALNLLPFAAILDDNKRFLVQRFHFSYLTSGRDLLRLSVKVDSKGGTVIFADPSFDDSGAKAPSKEGTRGLRARALRSMKWEKLPGTAEEAVAIVKLLAKATLHTGDDATEDQLKKISAPRILHLATHGFFLPGDEIDESFDAGGAPPGAPMAVAATSGPGLGSGQDNPLLRSGLALAGANKLESGSEDGVLTALEASGLDLWGTKLVVLSACETGVGKVSQGDGVYGLRRALVIAGAESLLMSLWQVDDAATRDMMTGYYRRLKAGKGRADALRLIQLKMLESQKYEHPYYWASFIPSGAWTPMKE